MRKGFTLIEVFFSLTVMVMAILGVFALVQQTIGALPLSEQRLIASYLAQEGIEIVRNLRDTNKINKSVWSQGLTSCASGCEADYNDGALSPAWSAGFLKIDNNFYQYSASGFLTPFQRKITITSPNSNVLEVKTDIFWSEKGRNHIFSSQENLYNW